MRMPLWRSAIRSTARATASETSSIMRLSPPAARYPPNRRD
jgi:hypothetical protein